MSDFLKIGKCAINPALISVVDAHNPDTVTVQVGASSVTAEGDDAKKLREHFGLKDEKADEKKASSPQATSDAKK